MDFPPAFWIGLFNTIWTFALSIYTVSTNNRKEDKKEISQLKTDLNGYGERLSRNEEKVLALPTHEHIGQVYEAIKKIGEGQKRLEGTIEQLKEIREQDRELRKADHEILQTIHRKIINEQK